MKKTVLRYGLFGALCIIIIFSITWLFFSVDSGNYAQQEVVGYGTILLSMIFVFFGIRHYRDKFNKGSISFLQGMKLGILIVIFPSIAFALMNLFYVVVLDPNFTEKYYAHEVEKLKSSLPAAELQAKLTEMEMQKEMFSSPAISSIVMFLTVFIIGLIVTIISALILKRSAQSSNT